MWILDQPDDVAERVGHFRDLDLLADFLRRLAIVAPAATNWRIAASICGTRQYATYRRVRAGVPAGPDRARLEAADVEADVERLIEVGRLLKSRGVPRLGAVDVPDVIDDGGNPSNM